MLVDISNLVYGRNRPPPGGLSSIRLTGTMLNVSRIKPVKRRGEGISLIELHNEFEKRVDMFEEQPNLSYVLKKYMNKLIELDDTIAYFVLVACRKLSDSELYKTSCEYTIKHNMLRMPFPSEDDQLQPVYKLKFMEIDRISPLPFDITLVLNDQLWQIEELEPEQPLNLNPWNDNGSLSELFRKLIYDDSLRALDDHITKDSSIKIEILSFSSEEIIKALLNLYSGISSEVFNVKEGHVGFVLPDYIEVKNDISFGIKKTKAILSTHLEFGNRLIESKRLLQASNFTGCKEVLRKAVVDEMDLFSCYLKEEIADITDLYTVLTRSHYYINSFLSFVLICERLLSDDLAATEISTYLQDNLARASDFLRDIVLRILVKVNILIVQSLYLFLEKSIIDLNDGVIIEGSNGTECVNISDESIKLITIRKTPLITNEICLNILWYGAIIREIAFDQNIRNPELHEMQKKIREPSTFVGKFLKMFMEEHREGISNLKYIFNFFIERNSQSKLIVCMRNEVKIASNIMYKLFLHRCQVPEKQHMGSTKYCIPDLPAEYQRDLFLRKSKETNDNKSNRLVVTLPKIVSVVITEKHYHGYNIIGESLQKIFDGFDAITHLSTRNHYLLPGEDRRAFYYKHVMDRVLTNLINHTYQTVSPLWDTFNEDLDNADTVPAMIESHRRFIREIRLNTIFNIVFTNKAFSFVSKMCECCILFAEAFNLGDSMKLENQYNEFKANLDLLLDVLETGDYNFQPLCGMLGRTVFAKSRNFIKM